MLPIQKGMQFNKYPFHNLNVFTDWGTCIPKSSWMLVIDWDEYEGKYAGKQSTSSESDRFDTLCWLLHVEDLLKETWLPSVGPIF